MKTPASVWFLTFVQHSNGTFCSARVAERFKFPPGKIAVIQWPTLALHYNRNQGIADLISPV